MVSTAKLYMLKLLLKLKTNKTLKLLLADRKANRSILGNGRDSIKQAKMPYFH